MEREEMQKDGTGEDGERWKKGGGGKEGRRRRKLERKEVKKAGKEGRGKESWKRRRK